MSTISSTESTTTPDIITTSTKTHVTRTTTLRKATTPLPPAIFKTTRTEESEKLLPVEKKPKKVASRNQGLSASFDHVSASQTKSDCPMDLLFVVDSSGSVGSVYKKQKVV